jgi:hypothetical protein
MYSKHILTRFRRLFVNKIFVSKAELKHTSYKIIITLYIYNEERRILLNRLRTIEAMLFPSLKSNSSKILSFNEKLNVIEKEITNSSLFSLLDECKKHIIEEISLEKKVFETINKLKLRSKKLLKVEALEKNIKDILTIIASCKNDSFSFIEYKNIYNKFIAKTLLERELTIIIYFKLLLSLNEYKIEDKFLLKLKPFISKIYNKEVEFNIVNLRAIYLNSDIFTQAISLKLRNRNNGLLTVFRYFLYMVKYPKINFLKERFAHISIKNL